MQGLSMNHLIKDATFIEQDTTAPIYKLFSIEDKYPAMVMSDKGEKGYSISGETYDIPDELWPKIFHNERYLGLHRGYIWLKDGESRLGILSVPELCLGYIDISSFGGWKEYKNHLSIPN